MKKIDQYQSVIDTRTVKFKGPQEFLELRHFLSQDIGKSQLKTKKRRISKKQTYQLERSTTF